MNPVDSLMFGKFAFGGFFMMLNCKLQFGQ